ncbi:MAG TPA: YbhB/YbcL family Raf kinase inhibitor-like protein [Kofleriaceae bacterium]
MEQHRLWWGIPRLVLIEGVLALGALALLFALSLSGRSASAESDSHPRPFTLTSPDFPECGSLPHRSKLDRFGCNGRNLAPTLRWTEVPPGTVSVALTMTDYDAPVAGGFHHWVVYNIPAHVDMVNGFSPFTQGTNSFGSPGYGGPCPPADGQIHHYIFTLYALMTRENLKEGLTYEELIPLISPDVIGATVMIGTFVRR